MARTKEMQMETTTERALNLADRSQSHPVRECDRCGADIAFVRSKKTGRYYAAEVVRTPSESFTRMENVRVAPWQPHSRERCEGRQTEREERQREIRERDEMGLFVDEFDSLTALIDRARGLAPLGR